jgi:hypothetical protein
MNNVFTAMIRTKAAPQRTRWTPTPLDQSPIGQMIRNAAAIDARAATPWLNPGDMRDAAYTFLLTFTGALIFFS